MKWKYYSKENILKELKFGHPKSVNVDSSLLPLEDGQILEEGIDFKVDFKEERSVNIIHPEDGPIPIKIMIAKPLGKPWHKPFQTLVDQVYAHQAHFSERQWPTLHFHGPLNHLREEIEEAKSGILSEFADCQLLLWDALRRAHPEICMDEFLLVCEEKIKINESRKWGPLDKKGISHHVTPKMHDQDAPNYQADEAE